VAIAEANVVPAVVPAWVRDTVIRLSAYTGTVDSERVDVVADPAGEVVLRLGEHQGIGGCLNTGERGSPGRGAEAVIFRDVVEAQTVTHLGCLARASEDLRILDVGLDQIVPPVGVPAVGKRHKHFIVVLGVHREGEIQLLDVVETARLPRLFSGASEDRKENRCQDRYDGDHHQQFDERESLSHLYPLLVSVCTFTSLRPVETDEATTSLRSGRAQLR